MSPAAHPQVKLLVGRGNHNKSLMMNITHHVSFATSPYKFTTLSLPVRDFLTIHLARVFLVHFRIAMLEPSVVATIATAITVALSLFILPRTMWPFCKALMKLKDKHVLITGGSSGIGLSAAREFLRHGARVTLVARRAAPLEEAQQSLSAIGHVSTMQCDCTDAEQVEKVVDEIESNIAPVDILLNCAGGATGGHFEEHNASTLHDGMQKNYFAQAYPTHAVFKRMKTRRSGHIVLVSSIAGVLGVFGYSAYTPAKFALRGLGEVLYYEGKPYQIGISILLPPDTDTPGYENEKKTMPAASLAISSGAGVFSPDTVAKKLLQGVRVGSFRITVGMDGALVGAVTAGMAPGATVLEALLMPFLRLASIFYVWSWNRIVRREHLARGAASGNKTDN